MLKWIWGFFFGLRLESVLDQTKVVKVKGVAFRIKKINALDYMAGYQVLRQVYDVYKPGKPAAEQEQNIKKVRELLGHTIVSGVVSPKISLKEEPGAIHIDRLFANWEMANRLFEEITEYSYGKKKVSRFASLARRLSNSTLSRAGTEPGQASS